MMYNFNPLPLWEPNRPDDFVELLELDQRIQIWAQKVIFLTKLKSALL